MNKHLHRIVFNAARGMRMVVQETARSAGKATGATAAVALNALACVLVPIAASAQIAGALNVPNTLRPTVLVAPNGVPLVNIRTPSAAGVSRNVYNRFDVGTQGAILNNSRTSTSTQLGGYVQGNPYLATGPARIILNEVNSGNPSQLRGYIEVGGSRAEVIIANPAGIAVDGGGFINASRATLTTGAPQFGAMGSLDSFLVQGGTVTVNGAGLDLSTTDYAAILARAVNVNAAIYATDLKVVTGANQVSADHAQMTPMPGAGAAPTFALDVSALGGMYAGKIVLVGTEAGLGVRNAGSIGASAGSLVVTAAGRLENSGTLEGPSVQLTTPDEINNRGGTIRQTGNASLTLSALALSNTQGGQIGAEPAPVAPGGGGAAGGGTGTGAGGTSTGTGTTTGGAAQGSSGTTPAHVPPAPGVITAGGAILNDGGKIHAGGPITLKTQNLINNGGTLGVASMTVNQARFSNHGGTLNVSGAFSANVGSFDNSTGTLHAGSLSIYTTGDLLNVDGTLMSDGDASLTVGGTVDNTRGTIAATGALSANVTGAINSTSGKLASNQSLTLASQSLNNSQGILSSAKGNVQLTVAQQTFNTDGRIASGAGLSLQTGSLDGSKGHLQAVVDLSVSGTQTLTATGSNIAGGQVTLQGSAVDLSGSQTGGAQVAITATQGNVTTSGATLVTSGTLTITANSQSGQTLVNDAGTLQADKLQIDVANLTNTKAGAIVQSGATATTLAVAGTIDNRGGTIASAGDLSVSAATVNNQGGKLQAAGASSLSVSAVDQLDNSAAGQILAGGNTTVQAGSLVNDHGGKITAVGDLTVAVSGAASNQGGTIAANGNATLNAASFQNSGGTAAAVEGGLKVTTTGATANVGGTLQAGGTTTLSNAGLDNSSGKIYGQTVNVDSHGQQFANSNGTLAATDAVDLQTGTLVNAAGLIQSGGAMTVDTHGQALDNTQANGKGGIASGGTLSLSAGVVNNHAGFIGSKGALVASTDGFSNTGGGLVLGQADVTIDTRGGSFNNKTGAVRADQNVTVTSGGTVDNSTGGLLSAGDTLKVVDPNAANPGAKTLNLVNTLGTLVANDSVQIDAAGFSGDGTLVSGKDLSIALTQDIVNNAKVVANGSLSYGTTGNLTNNGQLIAGNTLTVGGNSVTNTASAEMAGTNTTLNAGTLTNRGLIDSRGLTRIDAGAVNNVGSGRIYGNHVAVATGTLTNDAETVNGVTQAGTIAARQRLDIAASTLTNREHALILSGGAMGIGGALNDKSMAVGSGGTLNNLSARIESLGEMSVAMGSINNFDTHVRLGPPVTTTSSLTTIAAIDGSRMYTLNEVVVLAGLPFVWARNPDGSTGALISSNGYGIWNTTYTTTKDTAVNADPAAIVSGGDMTLTGAVRNRDSRLIAGGALTAPDAKNDALQGNYQTTSVALVVDDKGKVQPSVIGPRQAGTTNVGAYEYAQYVNATVGATIGSAAGGTASANGGGAGAAGGTRNPTIVEVAANVGTVVKPGQASAGTGTTVPTVVRTSTPTLSLPLASLYRTNAGSGRYLVETDPRFANYRQWLSSDYLLNSLGVDPNSTLKRLADGFYEQQLITQQIAQLTGYRFVDGYDNDQDQYTALMNSGVTFAKAYGLKVGVALSAAQMAQLTSDTVWLVEQTVTLPDGTKQQVLVPQVYVRVRPGDIDGSGALLSADAMLIKGSGDLVNTGTIAGRSLVSINAENVNNLSGGRIAGGSVGINARNDINNIGASITASDAAVLTAGRDIHIRTTTGSGSAGNQNIDRVAGVYVSHPDGVLIASAGRDVSLVAGILSSAGSVSVGAGRNINLGTVTESGTGSSSGQGTTGNVSFSREVGSVIQGNGNVRLAAGNDLNIRAGGVQSNNGALVATAKNDINITAGQATSNLTTSSVRSSGGVMRRTTTSTFDSSSTTDVLSSSLSGKTVALVGGNDINAQAAQLSSQDAMSLSAGRDINFTTATASSTELHASQTRTNPTALGRAWAVASDAGGPVGGYGNRSSSGNSTSVDSRTQAVGTTVSAGSLQTVSGRDTTLTGTTVVADGDIAMLAGRNLTLQSAQNTEFSSSSSANARSGFIGTWSSPGLGHIKTFQAQTDSSTTQTPTQVASLKGDVTLVAGNTYTQTGSSVLAAGLAGPLAGGNVNILAKNVIINEAYNTSQSLSYQRAESTQLGGSASVSFMGVGVSTNGSRLTSNTVLDTVRDMGNTSNGRARLLGAANLGMQGKQIYDGLQGLRTMPVAAAGASGAAGTGGLLTGGSAIPGLSYGVSVSLGHNNSQGTSATNSTQAVGSSVTGARNVNIVATGGGADSNVLISGSAITAGNAVNLAADNAVTLQASKDSSITTGRDSSSGASVGATLGVGTQNGLSFQVGVTQGQGRNDQVQVQNNPSQVSAGNTVNISTGGDLNLIGSTVQANRVNADVGGNLNITTLQDVRAGNTSQSSSGLGLSVCIPPICYGATVMPSVNIAGASANGLTVSPTTQAGIRAGNGGFDVNVRGNTRLTGAVIQSTQAAIDANRNRFQTGGTLTMTDLHNTSSARGAAYAAGASIGIGSSGPATDTAPNGINWQGGSGKPSGSAGVGSYSGDEQNSTTTSGISGIAGNQSVRTGDTTSAGTLMANWNTQAILQDVQAQARITAQFGQQATMAWGKYANDKLAEARKNEDAQAIACWEANGACRAAGHAGIGGLTGGAAGATGAVLSTQVAPIVDRIADEMGLSESSRNLVVAGLTTVVGATAGGVAGAAGAFNEVNNNFLTGKQVAQKEKELADCKKNDNCLAVSDKWKRLDMEQQSALDKLHEAERAMLKSPSEANVKELADAKRAWADLYEKFRLDGDTGGMKFVKDVYFTANLNYQLACANTASGCALPGRSEIMTSLAMSIDIAMATDGALAGIARSIVNRVQGPITSDGNAGISSVSGLRNQLEGQNISNIAAQDARLSAVLQGSGSKNSNFSIGSATSQESNKLGQIWVGDGARPLSGVPGGWISADETRVYRPPTTKPNTPAQFNPTGVQANFIVRDPNTGANISNGHLIIK